MDQSLVAFLFLLTSVLLARLLSTHGIEGLSPAHKGELLKGFTRFRILTFLVFLMIGCLGALLFRYWNLSVQVWVGSYTGLFILYLFTLVFLSYKRLRRQEFPSSYLKNYLWSSLIRISGVLIFIFLLMGEYWNQA